MTDFMIVADDIAVLRYDAVNIRLKLDKLQLALTGSQRGDSFTIRL